MQIKTTCNEKITFFRKSLDDVKYEQYVNNLHDRLPQLTDPSEIDCKRWPWELCKMQKILLLKEKNQKNAMLM